ncbi:peroxidase isoform X1 [Neodiprion pinetum]|uniref:peroxidase isoform X1 n=2 Tax=Neodiprion pinetum TaxID=441929 RepID=UPI001EE14494|nr:peroxidase-like isoform X1 [Neodiprion pinetum]
MILAPNDSDRWAYAMYGIEKPMERISAKGVMAGSVATLAVLWISLQGMGFVAQPSTIDASRLPISMQNYLSFSAGFPSLTRRDELRMNSRRFLGGSSFPVIGPEAINSSIDFAEMLVDQMARLEANIAGAGISFSNDSPTHGQYAHWYPTMEAHKKSVSALVVVKASSYLAQNNCQRSGFRNERCARFISTLKMEDTVIGRNCANEHRIDCDGGSRYRTIDGTCNNLDNPRWGSVMTAYSRILFPNYADGIQALRRPERRGKELPGPRSVSTSISPSDNQESDSTKTLAVMQWTQFVANDVSHTPMRKMVTNNKPITCCRSNGFFLAPRHTHPDCAPISIPDNDPVYGKERIRCMNYVRSMPTVRPDCSFGPTEQVNQVTHFLDGSTVYGSTSKTARELRAFSDGLLRVSLKNGSEYLPTAVSEPASLCRDNGCYAAGDFRVNHVPHLAVMHTIWLREHNRIARELGRLNPIWSDEIIFQEARRVVIAEIQHITYNEWLPVILGTNQTRYGHLFPVTANRASQLYDSRENPSITNEAATAVFRFMNSLVQGKLRMHDEARSVTGSLKLHEHFGKSKVIEDAGFLDSLIRGLTTQNSQKMDVKLVSDMTQKLHKTHGNLGLDSMSLDIQRGRDHGIPGYNHYREHCGLSLASTFDEFLDTIPIEVVEKLSMLYNHPNDVDLVVGGMAERPSHGGLLGPTLSCLVSEQFDTIRRSDRFFYNSASQPHPFTGDQLHALRNVSLARIFCENGDNIASMQPHVFLKLQLGNELAPCDDYEAIPTVDLFAWAEKAKAYR